MNDYITIASVVVALVCIIRATVWKRRYKRLLLKREVDKFWK